MTPNTMQDATMPVQDANSDLPTPQQVRNLLATVKPLPLCLDDLAEQTATVLSLKEPLSREFLKVAFANAQLFDKKQQDYGPGNIAGYGTLGVVVRMNDKFERLKNLLKKREDGRRRKAQNEPLADSLKDISNYGIIAEMVEKGVWK